MTSPSKPLSASTLALAPVPAMVQTAGMKGFAAEFKNLDHYIRVITERI